MEKQTVFNQVVKHLRAMKHRSLNNDPEGRCVYRGSLGNKCAIGILIPDEMYRTSFEYQGVKRLLENFSVLREFFKPIDLELLVELQKAHDIPGHWDGRGFNLLGEIHLKRTAIRYGLEFPEPNN